jgi:hypothetical protein
MTLDPALSHRLAFLLRVVSRAGDHLMLTDDRLFAAPFDVARAERLLVDHDLAERVEAFVGRFARLQDTLGDKLIPVVLAALGEKPGAAIDNLDRAERLGFIHSADEWLTMRQLRNQMVHEYVEDPAVLAGALASAHAFVPSLLSAVAAIGREVARRGWHAADARP